MSRDSGLWLWIVGGLVALALIGGGGVAVVTAFGKQSIAQIAAVAAEAGFTGADLVTAVAIALAESNGGDPNAKGDIDVPAAGSASYGLWQINSYWHPEYGPDFTQLFIPRNNAAAAYAIYVAAGRSFTPWSTYKNGAYQAHVANVQQNLMTG